MSDEGRVVDIVFMGFIKTVDKVHLVGLSEV